MELFPWFLIENLMGCHWKIIHFDWKIPCGTLWFVIGNHFIWWCSPMGLIQLIPIKEVIALMLLIKGSIHKLMLKCLAEIIEPMRGWLIGYGSLINAFGTFPMVSHWKSYGLPLENHSFWLKNSTWNLMICHWKSFKYTAHVSIQLHFIIPPMLMMLNVYHNVSLGSQKLINPTPCPCFSMAT